MMMLFQLYHQVQIKIIITIIIAIILVNGGVIKSENGNNLDIINAITKKNTIMTITNRFYSNYFKSIITTYYLLLFIYLL
ncbi:hypothetical protein BJ944DRAFT_271265 [Cunninghamella echinulata]|nr:hypothetical protein BJ944DRAFT_271265 [Cunninghamella echinulata]